MSMTVLEFLSAVALALIAGGGLGVAVVNGINERKMHKLQREDDKEDKAALETEKRVKAVEEKVDALIDANKYILYDRIRYLGQKYISSGVIDIDDRRILNGMHTSYHDGLGGNGDLDKLMEAVNDLPLKTR